MGIFSIIYWVIIVLAIIGFFMPPTWARLNSLALIVLFVLLGIKVFPVPLH